MARGLKIFLLIGGAWPVQAFAQDFEIGAVPVAPQQSPPLFTSELEVGFGHQDTGSFFFGRYGGLTKPGAFAFADGFISRRPAWDSDDASFFESRFNFNGQDLPAVSMGYGVQGHWKIAAFFNSYTFSDTESARTPFTGVGGTTLALPANWIGQASSLLFPNLQADLEPLKLQVRWQTVGGDYTLTPREGYEMRIHYDHRDRDGLQSNYLPFGQEPNFPVGVFFAQPVSYHSNHMTASLGYANRTLQWNFSYSLSTFDDGLTSVMVQNPYARSLGTPWPAGAFAGYPFSYGQYSTPPDNSAHQVALSGGYAITPQLRLTGKVSYAIQLQNAPFLPYTDNANLNVTTPLPRASLDGDVRKTFANLTLIGHEGKTFDMTMSYTLDDRDNRTPQSLYSYIPNDAQDQVSAALNGVSRYIRYNLPHSYLFQRAKLDLAYRFTPHTRLTLSYNGDFEHRNFQEVERLDDHNFRAKLQTTMGRGSAWVSYSYDIRLGSNYLDALPWNDSHTANYLNAGPQDQSIQYPLLRMYNLANRHRQEAKSGGTYDLSNAMTATFSAGYAKNNYVNSLFGLQSSDSLLGDADLSYTVKDRLTATAFYTFERARTNQAGYFLFTAQLNNAAQAWTAGNQDTVHSVGVKVDWTAVPNKWKFGANYYLSNGVTHIDVQDTPFTPLAVVSPMPNTRELTHNASVHAEYSLRESLAFRIGYTYEHHITDDWRYLESLTPVAQILGSGEAAPRYTAHVIWISTRTRF